MKYEYKFVKVKLKGFMTIKPQQDYKAIIHEHAQEGWRLVQVFAPATSGYGIATYFEMIFEKPIEE